MNEEQLIEFINWLPTAVPEFQNASPEQIVQTLNQLYESEEGQATLSQLFTAFQESKNEPQSQMFKKGGKLDQLTQKAKKGKKMCCKKKEIVQGGMVNKIAEKMQNGGEIVKRISASSLGYNPYGIMDKIGTSGGLQQVAGRKAIKSMILDNAQQNGQILSRKDLRQQTKAANFVNRAQEGLIGEGRLNKKLPQMMAVVNSIPIAQEGGEFDNPLVRNATLSTLGILDSTRPFIQQNVTPNETREFYAYSRDRLPDNVGGTGNFEGAIRTITPQDTTISYQLPGLAIYTAASSKDRGPRWKEMNSKMDSIKNKANKQKNK